VGEQESTQSFEIRKDPRIPTTASEFQEQFDLLMGIRDRLSEVHEAIAAVVDLQKQSMRSRPGERRAGCGRRRQARALRSSRSSNGSTAALHRRGRSRFSASSERAARFGGVVASADRAPTAAATACSAIVVALDAGLEELQAIVSSELPALNRTAQEKGMGLVSSMLRFAPDPRGRGR
jgi:hypothetical protein